LGNVVAWNRHDRAQINKIGEIFVIEDFIRHVEGELREKEEAKLKNNAASQFQFYDSSDLRSRLPRKERRRLKRKKSPTPRRRACSPLSYAKRASPSYNPYKSDGISDTTTDSEENSTAKQARVEFITEMTGTAQPVESSQPYYQEVEPYFRVTEKKREVDSSRSLSIRERMALKRQLALVKQLRQDQAKQQEKIDRKEDEMKLRRDGLRELGRKIQERRRKEQRRLRSDSFSSSMSRSRSRSRSRSKERRQSRAR
jgi:arginine/serine-rich splicing factor 16